MITEFVHYTRLPDLKLSSESLNQVLSNTLRSFREWRRLARVDIDEAFDPDLPPTRVDIFLLDQAFHNVIKNALEAIHPHGRIRILTRKLKIRHGPKPHLEFAEVIFEDNGPGIAPEDVDEVIKPFYSKKRDGMGLGLALTDHIIRAHGGAVNVENRNEGGTRVRIYLPIR
jgi:signal transduction histidine kinase